MHNFISKIFLLFFTFLSYNERFGAHGSGDGDWTGICKTGQSQSPIDLFRGISKPMAMDMDKMVFQNPVVNSYMIVNNKHTFQINFDKGSPMLEIKFFADHSKTYVLDQLHFHWGDGESKGGEHKLDGKIFPEELHLVTRKKKFASFLDALKSNESDALAVLGIFLEVDSQDNPDLEQIIKNIEPVKDWSDSTEKGTRGTKPFNVNSLIPKMSNLYRYMGSLTTPTCNEVVHWTIFEKPMKISTAQLSTFRNINVNGKKVVNNYREPQPLNGRTLHYITVNWK